MKALFFLLLLIFLLTGGCRGRQPPDENLKWDTAWVVYWDPELKERAEKFCLFSCLFEESGEVILPQELEEIKDELPGTVFLSFTNDVRHPDGTAVQKDAAFLEQQWKDPGMEEMIDSILELSSSFGAGGIEIDFENLGKAGLWEKFITFLEKLYSRTEEEGLPLRVVLGVDAPVEDLPEGPEYAVMCYNLYGTHSGPGPKADLAFLEDTAGRFSSLPGIHYALATGGFLWKGEEVQSLTQVQAEEMAAEKNAKPGRDPGSYALSFSWREATVWYADGTTLARWQQQIREVDGDARFDLWRAGGNRF